MPFLTRCLVLIATQLIAVALHSSSSANAASCGCIAGWNGYWYCSSTARCDPACQSTVRSFSSIAACRNANPQRAKAQTPAPKTVQADAPKKPPAVKPAQKTAQSKPDLPKTKPETPKITTPKKDMARLKPEKQPAAAAETSIVKQDSVVAPQAQEPVASANLSPEATAPALQAQPDKQTLGRRIALVIGNSAYAAVPALKNPATDARAIADTLGKLGFEKVTLKLDLDREATSEALAEFADQASQADWAVVYYAGHGIEVDGQNYIIPVDAKLDSDRKVMFETVPLDHVVEATAGARKFRLVILDACRNNPFLSSMTRMASSRSIGRGLSRVEPQGGVLVAYAAKAGEIALDGETGNSPFVTALVDQLKQPGVEVGFLFRRVRDSVLDMTNGTQEPYTYGSLPGREELYFSPPAN